MSTWAKFSACTTCCASDSKLKHSWSLCATFFPAPCRRPRQSVRRTLGWKGPAGLYWTARTSGNQARSQVRGSSIPTLLRTIQSCQCVVRRPAPFSLNRPHQTTLRVPHGILCSRPKSHTLSTGLNVISSSAKRIYMVDRRDQRAPSARFWSMDHITDRPSACYM